MNQCVFIGNFTADPELKYTKEGKAVCSFNLGVNKKGKKANGEPFSKAVFPSFEIWDTAAEVIGKYFKKGDPIIISESEYKIDEWTDKEGQKRTRGIFRVNRFEFPPQNKRRLDEVESDPQPAEVGSENDTNVPF